MAFLRKMVATWKHFILALLFAFPFAAFLLIQPSNIRDWSDDQAVLPQAVRDGDFIHIRNIRNTQYRSVSNYTVFYEDKTYNLNQLETVWYICEPFSTWRGMAHTFVSFGFSNGEYVAISVEIRKEKGESFSPVKGLLKQFELMYVVGDERDLIKLRTQFRHDEVFLYPLKLDPGTARKLFIQMLEKANDLRDHPEFYHTLSNTCTTTIVGHINRILPGRIPFSFSLIFPGFSDDYFFHLGLIDTTLPFQQYRNHFRINHRAEEFADDPDFSRHIRDFEH